MTDTTIDRLVAFVAARLDEDGKVIDAASTDVGSDGGWTATRNEQGAPTVTCVGLGRELVVASPLGTQDAEFMDRFDPKRGRREVEYGRWLLADHADRRSVQSLDGLRRYAVRWQEHTDWDDAWRPVERGKYTEETP